MAFAFTNAAAKLCYQLSSMIGALYPRVVFGYKGILLIFGIFLAYKTQSVRLKQVNDSRFVGIGTYNAVNKEVLQHPPSDGQMGKSLTACGQPGGRGETPEEYGGSSEKTKSQAAGEPRRLAYMELDHHNHDFITRPAADDEG
ncbi:hypothetical protein RRG08_001274 [Elysia crispata]|uniref:Uncharacterized protein n=1 Tax=Elysia crispata TaxID=231223 RepID=A0AAE1B300_9GAST|nr:hypothetical protein RRG08_001274 [Elysia crispata]